MVYWISLTDFHRGFSNEHNNRNVIYSTSAAIERRSSATMCRVSRCLLTSDWGDINCELGDNLRLVRSTRVSLVRRDQMRPCVVFTCVSSITHFRRVIRSLIPFSDILSFIPSPNDSVYVSSFQITRSTVTLTLACGLFAQTSPSAPIALHRTNEVKPTIYNHSYCPSWALNYLQDEGVVFTTTYLFYNVKQ